MTEQVYVLGGGGHASVVIDTLLCNKIEISGVLDPQYQEISGYILGIPVLGSDDYLNQALGSKVRLISGLGANPNTSPREKLFTRMKVRGFSFLHLQHPSAIISPFTKIGEGCQLLAGSILQAGVSLGQNVVINTRASIDHDCEIESHVFVGPGAVLCGHVRVAHSAFVGAGAVILPGVTIGNHAIVGAGAIATKDIPDRSIIKNRY
jgi:sugar O-acyltransferase (sialic acid O-acetyltransferase NeuD family)